MDAQTAQQKFTRSDELYRQGQYEEALILLSELNSVFPNTKNVMYPAALCMEKLGRIEEAKLLCHGMIRQFDYQKARELLNHLEVAPRIAMPPAEASVNLERPPHVRAMPGEMPEEGSRKNLYIIIGAIVAAVALLGLPLLLHKGETPAVSMESALSGFFIVLIAIAFLCYLLGCYLMKRICENAGSDPGALIWVPVLQILPIMKAADMNLVWLLVVFVPFVGGILFTGVLWIKLCQACNKPAWLGILAFVPVANIFLILYLAFSSPE